MTSDNVAFSTSAVLRSLWQRDLPTFGLWSSLSDPFTAELLATTSFDYVCVDLQHGLATFSELPQHASGHARGWCRSTRPGGLERTCADHACLRHRCVRRSRSHGQQRRGGPSGSGRLSLPTHRRAQLGAVVGPHPRCAPCPAGRAGRRGDLPGHGGDPGGGGRTRGDRRRAGRRRRLRRPQRPGPDLRIRARDLPGLARGGRPPPANRGHLPARRRRHRPALLGRRDGQPLGGSRGPDAHGGPRRHPAPRSRGGRLGTARRGDRDRLRPRGRRGVRHIPPRSGRQPAGRAGVVDREPMHYRSGTSQACVR